MSFPSMGVSYTSAVDAIRNASTDLPSHIDQSRLATPIPILGPLRGYTPEAIHKGINARLAIAAQSCGRSLTPAEANALAESTAAGVATTSYGTPLAVSLGVYRAWQTRGVMRFPLMGKVKLPEGQKLGKSVDFASQEAGKPREEVQEDAKKFAQDKRHVGLKTDGQKVHLFGKEILANLSVHQRMRLLNFVRGFTYVSLSLAVVPALTTLWAQAGLMRAEAQDARLEEFRVDQKRHLEEMARSRAKGGEQGRGSVWQQRQQQQQDKARSTSAAPSPAPSTPSSSTYDDASPSGGAGMLDDFIPDSSSPPSTPAQSKSSLPSSSSPQSYSRTKQQRRQLPTKTASESEGGNADGLSSWERIRQNANSGRNTGGDYTFSTSDAERSYARQSPFSASSSSSSAAAAGGRGKEDADAAQRDFDARLERERRGEEFGEGTQ